MSDRTSAGPFQIRIEPSGREYEAAPNQSLLMAAAEAGHRLPSSCRNGTCRTCICRLVQGEIAYRIDWPGVSLEEKQEGLILPCVAEARSDLVIDAPGATSVF